MMTLLVFEEKIPIYIWIEFTLEVFFNTNISNGIYE